MIEFDSREEFLFHAWWLEAESLGLVSDLTERPEFPLSDKASFNVPNPGPRSPDRTKEIFLLHPHKYTADYAFRAASSGSDIRLNDLAVPNEIKFFRPDDGDPVVVVDVKGGWCNSHSGRSSDVTFPVNRKWVYSRYGIFVNKVEIKPKKGFFSKLWAPSVAFKTPKGAPSKIYAGCKRLADVKGLLKNADKNDRQEPA